MSEATAVDPGGNKLRIVKGAFRTVSALSQSSPSAAAAAGELESKGYRVLAIAVGPPTGLKLVGLIALSDPPRADSAGLIAELRTLGVRTVMITGDAAQTAAIVARAVGLAGKVFPSGAVQGNTVQGKGRPEEFDVFAGVLPEGKYDLVKMFQNDGHIVGMCGDGVNDAPALRQSQMGIAVASATDVAKSAAGIVLTTPGLGGIVASVKEGRITFQRILTYTLNSVNKKVGQVLFLAIGLLMTGHAILTPLLMVIIMITGDFLGMSLTTDYVRPSPLPNVWRIGRLTTAGVFIGLAELIFCTAVLAVGQFAMQFELGALRTLAFVVIVFGNQATTYAVRERRRIWSSPPSAWLAASSLADITIASALAIFGIFMTPLPPLAVASTLAAAIAFAFVVDAAKVPVFARLRIF
jgi:H+-transporting ATPase